MPAAPRRATSSSRPKPASTSSSAATPPPPASRPPRPAAPPAAARGRDERAERQCAQARQRHAKMGAKPTFARSQVSSAELLLARRAAEDVGRAREMLADAIVGADALGMTVLGERARRL